MGLKEARDHLSLFSLEDRIIEFDTSSATVELAAEAVGCKPEFIVKTLAFMVKEDPILIRLGPHRQCKIQKDLSLQNKNDE